MSNSILFIASIFYLLVAFYIGKDVVKIYLKNNSINEECIITLICTLVNAFAGGYFLGQIFK